MSRKEKFAFYMMPEKKALLERRYRDGPLLIPDSRRTKHWLVQAAKQNLPEAQYALGKLLLSDDPEVRDPDEGIRWLKEAAAQERYEEAAQLRDHIARMEKEVCAHEG